MQSIFTRRSHALVSALVACITTACGAGPVDDPEFVGPRGDNEVIDGNTDFAGKEYQRDHTLHVHTPANNWCSGTPLLPNAVMTARHCVTADGTVAGPIGSATDFRARIRAIAPEPATPDLCTGTTRDPTCARGRRIFDFGTTFDIALVELENPLSHQNLALPFTPIELDTPIDDYLDTSRIVTGWGMNTCEAGQGTLRWGQVTVTGVAPVQLTLSAGPAGQNFWKGDSGGPTWGDTLPYSIISVHSMAHCERLKGYDVPLGKHLPALRDALESITPASVTRELGALAEVDLVPATESNWQIRNGRLQKFAKTDRNFALLRGLAFQQLVDTEVSVKLNGSDDGSSGLVLNYYDANNYVLCELTAATNELRLIGRHGGTDTVLESVPWNGSFSTDVTLSARMQPNAAGKDSFTCAVSGGGGVSATASGVFAELTAGRAGVFNRNNANTSYWHVVARKL